VEVSVVAADKVVVKADAVVKVALVVVEKADVVSKKNAKSQNLNKKFLILPALLV
jgi:hypothetical protein